MEKINNFLVLNINNKYLFLSFIFSIVLMLIHPVFTLLAVFIFYIFSFYKIDFKVFRILPKEQLENFYEYLKRHDFLENDKIKFSDYLLWKDIYLKNIEKEKNKEFLDINKNRNEKIFEELLKKD